MGMNECLKAHQKQKGHLVPYPQNKTMVPCYFVIVENHYKAINKLIVQNTWTVSD